MKVQSKKEEDLESIMVSIEYREEPEKISKEDKIAILETNFSEMKGQMEELTKKVKKLEQASNSNNDNKKGNLQTEEFIPYVEEASI